MRKHGGFTRLDAGRGGGKAGPPDLGRLPTGASFIRGGVLPEIGWFSSTRAEKAGRRDLCSKAMTPLTWPMLAGCSRPPSARSGKLPPKSPLLMKTTRFLAGLPQFFCHGSSQRGAACTDKCAQASRATRTLGRSCRSDLMPCSSANPSSPCSTLSPQTPSACSWQLLDEHGESFRIASKSNG